MNDTPELTPFVRVFLEDESYADCRLVGTWEAFIFQYVTNNCVITSTMLIERSAVTKMIRMAALGVPDEIGNIIPFPDTKGSA